MFKKTVDSILADFQKKVADLRRIEGEKTDEAVELSRRAGEASREANRARVAAVRLESLIAPEEANG